MALASLPLAGRACGAALGSGRRPAASSRRPRIALPAVAAGQSAASCSGRDDSHLAMQRAAGIRCVNVRPNRLRVHVSASEPLSIAMSSLEKHQAHKNQPEAHNEVYGQL